MFAHTSTRGRVQVAFTDRVGGVSTGEFASLNLAGEGADDPGAVARNHELVREAFAGSASAPTVLMHEVHGADVVVVDGPGSGPPPRADGLATATPGLTLVVRAADCVPLLVADVDRGAVAALHAGRRGLVAGIVPAGVRALRGLGAERLVAWLGPYLCGRCYEVSADLRESVAAVVPEARARTAWGTPAVDLGAGLRAQLERAGVEVVDVGRCTREDPDLYSYRRDGARTGRLAGLVRVREVAA